MSKKVEVSQNVQEITDKCPRSDITAQSVFAVPSNRPARATKPYWRFSGDEFYQYDEVPEGWKVLTDGQLWKPYVAI